MENIKDNTKKVWGASPAGTTSTESKPMTKKFFDEAFKFRSEYEIPWLYEVIPFKEFKNKKVLEVGCGAGFDAYNIAREGGIYTGIDITPENIDRTKTHLGYFGLNTKVLEADAEQLPFEEEFDIVYSNGVLHHTPNMEKSFSEAYRVLKDNGEFYVVLYNKNSIFHWFTLFLVKHILMLGFLQMNFKDRLSMIEYTTSKEKPLVNVYSKNEVESILKKVGFTVNNNDLKIRKLVKEDLPYLPIIRNLWKIVPQSIYDKIGEKLGWYIIARGVKKIET